MGIQIAKVQSEVTLKLQKLNSGFGATSWGPHTFSFVQVSDPAVYNQAYVGKHTLAPTTGTVDIDLRSFTNLAGEAVVMSGVIELWLSVTGTGASVELTPGASNGLVWFWTGTDPKITVPAASHIHFCQPTHVVVDGTHKVLTLTNVGAGAAEATLVIIGKTG